MAGVTVEITDANFEAEVSNSDVPVVLDFWAEYCGPCRQLTPIVEALAEEYQGKVKVGKVDTMASQATAARFGITAIPTLIFFKNGEPVKQLRGLQPKKALAEAMDALL